MGISSKPTLHKLERGRLRYSRRVIKNKDSRVTNKTLGKLLTLFMPQFLACKMEMMTGLPFYGCEEHMGQHKKCLGQSAWYFVGVS